MNRASRQSRIPETPEFVIDVFSRKYILYYCIQRKQILRQEGRERAAMKQNNRPSRIVTELMLRLLPIQILLALIGSVNGIVSSLIGVNAIGSGSMTAVGLYSPVSMFVGAVSAMLVGGSQILCGQYMGENLVKKMQNVFSLDLAVSAAVSALVTVFLLLISIFDLGNFLVSEPASRPDFYQYALGQTAGVLPLIIGSQLSAFLSLENQNRRVTVASLVCIAVNLLLNVLLVIVLRMGILGLSLASSLSMWAFCAVEAGYFFSKGATLRFTFRGMQWREALTIARIGLPGAAGNGYQTLRCIIVNNLLAAYAGAAGVSAFATAGSLLGASWAIPAGMTAVSRMLFSISTGEEDRQTLIDTMRNALFRYVPMMFMVSAAIIALAVPLTELYFHDPSDPIYEMTVWCFRILPLCMPLSVICMQFVCYGQVSGKHGLVHVLAALDGVVFVAGFSALLTPSLGIRGVCYANVLNGLAILLVILGYALIKNRELSRSTEDLMVIPEDFGVEEPDRMSLSLASMEEVIRISQTIESFCLDKGIDRRRSYLSGLCMEEMAGNVISHGFTSDTKNHSVDVRVVYKNDGLILLIRDDCVGFDPAARNDIINPEDVTSNIGIRMVCSMAESVSYKSELGMNVLMMKI